MIEIALYYWSMKTFSHYFCKYFMYTLFVPHPDFTFYGFCFFSSVLNLLLYVRFFRISTNAIRHFENESNIFLSASGLYPYFYFTS